MGAKLLLVGFSSVFGQLAANLPLAEGFVASDSCLIAAVSVLFETLPSFSCSEFQNKIAQVFSAATPPPSPHHVVLLVALNPVLGSKLLLQVGLVK